MPVVHPWIPSLPTSMHQTYSYAYGHVVYIISLCIWQCGCVGKAQMNTDCKAVTVGEVIKNYCIQ